jgi:hypothetical protein
MATARRKRTRAPSWSTLPDEALLDLRICDLGLALEDTPLAPRLEQLHAELARKGLTWRPYAWLSSDWFAPDDATGFAVPFYLAHPRLVRLERGQMLEVEGGTHEECMKLMRHEAAHAVDNAYRLHRKKRWRETFGRFSTPYESSYAPDPNSRDFVLNLAYWYSQSHPAEDWAETFAVWLRPGSHWRARYAGWPALAKLEYVDEVMRGLRSAAPAVRSRVRDEPVARLRYTLREYYRRKRAHYEEEGTPAFDGQLKRLFSADPADAGRPSAVSFLRRERRALVRRVASTTGQHSYLVDHVVHEMILRCRSVEFHLRGTESETRLDAAVLLTALSMQFLFGGHPRYHR